MKPVTIMISLAALTARLVTAQSPSADALALLEQHCVRCHGGEKTKASLDLTTRESLVKGGESGAVINSSNPDESLLLKSIRHDADSKMPYKEPKLADDDISTITSWVKSGARYTRTLKAAPAKKPQEFAVTDADKSHWAFQPITRLTPPAIADYSNPIDKFIVAKLRDSKLALSPPASREHLIRRVTFDLIGLPPTPDEVKSFVNDSSPHAYENLIDRLLASPHYGERWARHWLDLARFAESDGYEHDAVRPHAWRYRDYVIRSFNSDKPYDQFIREQLAGDELRPDDPEAVTATAFNLLGPDMVDSSDQIQRRHNTLNDMTDTASLTFLGLTLGCARCHDHKFEPLSQRDYYSLQAFFTPAKFRPDAPIPTSAERAAFDAAVNEYNNHPKVLELAELEAEPRQEIFKRKVAQLSAEAQMAHNTPAVQRNAEQSNLVLETEDKVKITDADLNAAFTGEAKTRRKALLDEIKKLPRPRAVPQTIALIDENKPARAHILHRGEYSQPGEEVAPAIPVVLASLKKNELQPRRTALADWIASPENPLTARVMVNRIWQHHFGRGLVASPSNFGTHGVKPTHPELLDWLASEFIRRGWSIKQLHKTILLSAACQQTSSATAGAKIDPENRLLWRMNRIRLEGEAIRDSLLAISGELKRDIGGPGVFPPIPKELFQGATGWNAKENDPDSARRSIYIFARRNLRFPFLEVFDAPDNNLSCPIREQSTTAPQSLTLLNSDEVIHASELTAKKIAHDPDPIASAYELILNRPPTVNETQIAREFLASSPLHEFCRALFNLNDFVYVN